MGRNAVTVGASIAASLVFGAVLVGKWDELEAGITGAAVAVVLLAVALQVVALASRSEAWRVCVHSSGGTVSRRKLYRASSIGCVGNLLNHQLGTAARIAALRRSAPEETPRVPSLIAAELPILFVEAGLAALTSFTLGRSARPSLVDSDRMPRRRRLGGARLQEHRGRQGALAGQGPVGAALAAWQRLAGGPRADRRLRADSP